MPFTGPDPALMNFLAQRRQQREDSKRLNAKAQQDMFFKLQDEQRKRDTHNWELLVKRQELIDKRREALPDQAEFVSQAGADAEAFQSATDPFMLHDLEGPPTPDLVADRAAQAEHIEGLLGPARATIQQRADQRRALYPNESPEEAIVNAQSSLGTALSVRDARAERELEKVKAEEERGVENAKRLAENQAVLNARAESRKIETTVDAALAARTRATDTRLSEAQRENARMDHEFLAAELTGRMIRNTPDQYWKMKMAVSEDLERYDSVQSNLAGLKILRDAVFEGEAKIGMPAALAKWATNAVDLVETAFGMSFEDWYLDSVQQQISNYADNPEAQQKLRDTLLSDQVLQNIARGELGLVESAWSLNHMFNPSGRVNQKQLNAITDAIEFMSLTVGPRLAMARMNVLIERLEQDVKRQQKRINRRDPTLVWDENGEWFDPQTPMGAKLKEQAAERKRRPRRPFVVKPPRATGIEVPTLDEARKNMDGA